MLCIAASCSVDDGDTQWLTDVRFVQADSPAFSAVTHDDARWSKRRFWELPAPKPVLWIRGNIELTASDGPRAVFLAALAAHELWWDGVLIGRGGAVGRDAESEIPGAIEAHYMIPEALAQAGPHVVAVRTSAFHRGFSPTSGFWRLGVGSYDDVVAYRWRGSWIALISLSGILLGSLIAFAMFALSRRRGARSSHRATLLLGFFGVAVAALLVAEAWRPLRGYTYDWHIVRLITLVALSGVIHLLLLGYLVRRFPHPRLARPLLLAVPLLAVPVVVCPWWDDKIAFLHVVGLVLAAAWTAAAAYRQQTGAWQAFVILIVAVALVVPDRGAFVDRWIYFAIDGLFALLLLGHLLEWRNELLEHERALARSARLETELLRRHLQPHFMMNTLTAIGGWIEEEPKTAVRMIGALSDELRTLAAISDRSLVSLAEELCLCRAHLETMSLRRDIAYRLEAEGVDGAQLVPPALIHTLVENAVTHGPSAGAVAFRLESTCRDGRMFLTFASPRSEDTVLDAAPGTGTKYLLARLREAWGDDWSLTQRAVGGEWRVEIDVPRGAR